MEKAIIACKAKGGEPGWGWKRNQCYIEPPASEAEVATVERELGYRIPDSLRQVLRQFSRAVDFAWSLPRGLRPPGTLREVTSGECRWNLNGLVALEQKRNDWIRGVYSDPSDPYSAVYHNKFAFLEVGNDDLLTIDLNSAEGPGVVYLSHEGDTRSHGYRLGKDFQDFVDRWTRLACPGAEDWLWMPFTVTKTSGIDPNGDNAKAWQTWFDFHPSSE
jgi:hypothetical protein